MANPMNASGGDGSDRPRSPKRRRRGRTASVIALVLILAGAGAAFGPALWRWLKEPRAVALAGLDIDGMTPAMIVRPDGTRLTIQLPANRTAGQTWNWVGPAPGARARGGFVFQVRRDPGGLMPDGSAIPAGGPVPDGIEGPAANGSGGGSEVWFLRDGSTKPSFVAYFSGAWAVSVDGATLVLTGVMIDGYIRDTAAVAYRLPDLTVLQGPVDLGISQLIGPGSPRLIGVTATAAILQTYDHRGPVMAVWPLGAGVLRARPFSYALAITTDGRVLVKDARARDYEPPAEGIPPGPEHPCLNLVTIEVALANRPIGGACPADLGYERGASISPDGVWIIIADGFTDYKPVDDEDIQRHALVRSADIVAGRWAPIRQRPFAEREALGDIPYVWASSTTFIVQKSRFTLRDRLDPFKSGRSPVGFYLCNVDNSPCAPLELPDGLDDARPMERYPIS